MTPNTVVLYSFYVILGACKLKRNTGKEGSMIDDI